ncbi:ATP-binding protein [Piscinibacter gummiphilus]|uniref:histidine kinase n=1 Tax=Piscinibacter gummiphilus TaxID=946333 RepID=A0ABZ0D0U5_9BURK|nr:ATP-binding protein [Piscinibacter gummiphilus]WOB10831.1 ATP-binding protein [Piscinibacter gummiphilus]
MMAFSAFMVYREIAQRQERELAMMERRAATTAAAIGHELDGVLIALDTLALTDNARQGDMKATYELALRLTKSDPRLASISLSDRSGRQVFNTWRPFGAELPPSNVNEMLVPLFEGRADRVVSPLVVGAVSQQPVVGVARRIDMGPAGVFALRAIIRLNAIGNRFNEVEWLADGVAAIIDQRGIIIARSRDAERYVGQPSTPGLLQSLREGKGPFRAITKDGIATVANGAPVPGSGWYVVIGHPAAALEAQVRNSVATILLGGALCALLGIAAAIYTARSIGRQLRRVVDWHVSGAPGRAPVAGIKEVREIEEALASARHEVSKSFTEVEEARQDALDQLAQRGEMLDVLAHEVRQPLNNASAALQQANGVLQNSVSPEIRAPLSRANGVLSEVLASIDNTLAVAAQLVGDKQIRRVDFDIDALVAMAIADMATSEAPRVRIERLSGTRTATGEPNLLRLALRNLLSNALKFSPPNSEVVVRITDSDDPLAVIFDVIDSGPGIDAEMLPRLFDRGGRKRHHLGGRRQGLGLYIVRRVMQLHGGTATLERNGAQGTTMRLTLEQNSDE